MSSIAMALSRQFLSVPRLLSRCQRVAIGSQQRWDSTDSKSAGLAGLALTFTTPSEVFYREKIVKQVDVPTQTDTMGVLAQHVPAIGVLKPGVLSVFEDNDTKKFFVGGGSVTVTKDSQIHVLAEEAQPLENFQLESVLEELKAAQSQLSAAQDDQAKAEAQIAIECLESLKTAL